MAPRGGTIGLVSEHEREELPTSSMVPSAAGSGVWNPHHARESELAPTVPPDPQPKRPGLFARLRARLRGS